MGTAHNETAQDQLAHIIEKNMGLVVLLAKSFNPRNKDEYDEFIQLGRIGVWKAHIKYDPTRGTFPTLAWNYIKWEILRHLDKKNPETQLEEPMSIEDTKYICDSIWEYLPSNLSQKEKRVVKLRLIDRHTFLDIGNIMGYSRGWANNTYKRALEKIKHANE